MLSEKIRLERVLTEIGRITASVHKNDVVKAAYDLGRLHQDIIHIINELDDE